MATRTAPKPTPRSLDQVRDGTHLGPACPCQYPGPRLPRAEALGLAEKLKALADPTRLRILSQLLAAEEPICACDIASGYEQGQPTISHHLKILREARLVRAQRGGTWIHYSPDRRALREVGEALRSL